ncbi:MAG: TonB family protein [Flavobacterium sp.]|nr:TonB family protein [Flavobacterium sp.]HRB70830.1 TonB family protein [Flavobacterium sp.]
MINKLKMLTVCVLVGMGAFAQSAVNYEGEAINRLDKDGKKQGVWKLFDTERGITIVGKTEDDVFVSTIEYYFKDDLVLTYNTETKGYTFYEDLKGSPVTIVDKGNKLTEVVKDNGEVLDEKRRKVFFVVQELRPIFYGGKQGMHSFIEKAVRKSTLRHSGKVKLMWTIDNDGIVTNVKVMESENSALNEEAVRIIQSMPRWQPGIQRGSFVRVNFTTSIVFND